MVEISVVVCTLNRAASLSRTLTSLREQTLDVELFEVVVVDNGSTDATPQVVADAQAQAANVRYVHEATLGLSHARNRGIHEAAGAIVAFIDDDAEAAPTWIEELLAAIAQPEVGGAGGKISLVFPSTRPSWLPPRLEGHYSGLDLGDEAFTFPSGKGPYGTNMAIRRSLLLDVGGFATDLGRSGRNLMSSEEVDLFRRVRDAGSVVRYHPAALVHHHVEMARVSRRFLIRRAYAQGRSRALAEAHARPGSRATTWTRRALATAWVAVRDGTRGVFTAATAASHERPAEIMSELGRLASRSGFVVQSVLLAYRWRRPTS